MMKHKEGVWYPVTEVPNPEDGDTFALCVSGKPDNMRITYDHAVVLSNDNTYEEGKWYVKGYRWKDIVVHGWYIVPEMEETN